MDLLPLVLLSPVLVAAAYSDLRHMRIPNSFALLAVAIFFLSAPFLLPLDVLLVRIGIAAAALALGFLAFMLRMLGGGDAKMFAALLLFVPTETMSLFLLIFSAALVFGIALMPVLRALPNAAATGWVSLQRDARFPMGISIALAGLAHAPAVSLLSAH